jgi:hypothetical protein
MKTLIALLLLSIPAFADDLPPPVTKCQPMFNGQAVGPPMSVAQVYSGDLAILSRQLGINGSSTEHVTSGTFPTGANGDILPVPQQHTIVIGQALVCQ